VVDQSAWRLKGRRMCTPFVTSDRKPEASDCPALAAFDIKADRKSKFSVLLLAIAAVCRAITNVRLRSELTKGCTSRRLDRRTSNSASFQSDRI
jgi:hypothetical protein